MTLLSTWKTLATACLLLLLFCATASDVAADAPPGQVTVQLNSTENPNEIWVSFYGETLFTSGLGSSNGFAGGWTFPSLASSSDAALIYLANAPGIATTSTLQSAPIDAFIFVTGAGGSLFAFGTSASPDDIAPGSTITLPTGTFLFSLASGAPDSFTYGDLTKGTFISGDSILDPGVGFSSNAILTLIIGGILQPPVEAVPSSGGSVAPEPILLVTDVGAIGSALVSSVPTAFAQREAAFSAMHTALRDFNSRLFRARAGTSSGFDNQTSAGEGDGTEYHTVTIGEGDGVEGGKGTKVVYGTVKREALKWEVFTTFDYGNHDIDANKDFLGLRSDTYVETLGIERALGSHLVLGAGASFIQSNSKEGADVEGETFATYLSGAWGGAYADILYGVTLLEHDIDRKTGVGTTAHADPDSTSHAVNFNTGYNFYLGKWTTGPTVGVDYSHANVDGYTERGGETANTRVSEQSIDSLVTRLGWQASYRLDKSWGSITPQLRVGWERENLDGDDDITVGLLDSPYYLVQGRSIRSAGGDFEVTVPGYDRQKDFLTAGAGLYVEVGRHFNILLDYEGVFLDSGYSAHYGKVSLGWKF